MSDFIETFRSIDLLGLAFLAACLIFLWGLWRVLSDDLDLDAKPSEDRDPGQPPSGHPEPGAPHRPDAPRHRRSGARGRSRAA